MAIYRLKRKYFGVVGEAAKNTAGGVMEGTGKALDTGVAGTIGGVGGAMMAGAGIGSTAGLALGPIGMAGGYILGKAATKGLGKGLKNAGQDMQT